MRLTLWTSVGRPQALIVAHALSSARGQGARMGIRYYAYAVDADQADRALADPRAFISSDPLADAWGMKPHAAVSVASFEQTVPERDMLYLDKAWRGLQVLTGPRSGAGAARPAYRMFEGKVEMCGDGWIPWYRALAPAQVHEVAQDLGDLQREVAAVGLRRIGASGVNLSYAVDYLDRATRFVRRLAADGRGMAYMIG
ncbi:DUF1877 family protein [Nocardioides sp. MH1]|uniref:DUF1877 family protein n=1 Tax=Nocardioides sp. MH1 TaxID=3242490 RepID=UPI0035219E9F